MIKTMTMQEIKEEFDKIDKSSPNLDWDWVHKISHWEDFLLKGETAANLLRDLYISCTRFDKVNGEKEYEKDFRSLNPEFHDWLMKIFPKD